MKIGIIVAMQKELDLLLPLLNTHTQSKINGFTFHHGTIGNLQIIASKCGIGKVNAAIGTSTLIDHFAPELIINTGVAGGTGQGAGVLDVVVADRIAYHDVWCGPGTQWGTAAGCPPFFHTADRINSLPCLAEGENIKHGLIASGDIFISRPSDIEHILSLYPDATAVDMESAAIAQVCFIRGVDFACIRVVSDTPGADDNIAQYENFWDDAPRHTFELLRLILSQLAS